MRLKSPLVIFLNNNDNDDSDHYEAYYVDKDNDDNCSSHPWDFQKYNMHPKPQLATLHNYTSNSQLKS